MKTWKLVICAVVLILAVGVAAHALTKNSPAGSCESSSIVSSDQAADAVGEGCCPKKKSEKKSCPKSSKKECPKSSEKGCPKSDSKSCPKK